MENPIQIIDKMLEEHATIVQDTQGACSDATALTSLSQADKDFSPGRLDRAEGIKKLQETITRCDAGVAQHFSQEETGLLEVFKTHGNEEQLAQFHTLLKQHKELKDRFAEAKSRVDKLVSGEITGGNWNSAANDLMSYMNKTRQLIEEHASTEHTLFRALRKSIV